MKRASSKAKREGSAFHGLKKVQETLAGRAVAEVVG